MQNLSRVLCLAVLFAGVGQAQVLARPNWAGSGVAVETWWRRAVFYRIDPTMFQDSNGDGIGDVEGITQRLGYIQQLGVDAIILAPPFTADDFGTLARKAADLHIRVLAEIKSADPAQARTWLNQGAAGIFLDTRGNAPAAIRELRHVSDGFPGERILLATGVLPSNDGAHLSVSGNFSTLRTAAGPMRQQLQSGLDAAVATGAPLLQLSGLAMGPVSAGGQQAIAERALATMLLASRAAVMFDAGRELGLRSVDGKPVAMQWTPANVTRETPVPAPSKPATPQAEVYGTYTPYIPPPKAILPAPKLPNVVESAVPPPPDPNTLPGFTSSDPQTVVALNGAGASVAVEELNPNSLLNFYRHLIALHHDNGSLRHGSQTMIDRDVLNTMVWVRRAPAGSRTAASLVVACNLSEQPREISLGSEFAQLHMRGGTLRPLLTASVGETAVIPLESAERLVLPAYAVFLGELYHSSSDEVVVVRAPSHRSTRKRHRH